jgi:hypothetical protein
MIVIEAGKFETMQQSFQILARLYGADKKDKRKVIIANYFSSTVHSLGAR